MKTITQLHISSKFWTWYAYLWYSRISSVVMWNQNQLWELMFRWTQSFSNLFKTYGLNQRISLETCIKDDSRNYLKWGNKNWMLKKKKRKRRGILCVKCLWISRIVFNYSERTDKLNSICFLDQATTVREPFFVASTLSPQILVFYKKIKRLFCRGYFQNQHNHTPITAH